MAIFGPWEQPIFEGWSVLAGARPADLAVRLGLMVGANTFRNPGLTAKLATTLDHLSGGRAVLGIGGAWFEREHDGLRHRLRRERRRAARSARRVGDARCAGCSMASGSATRAASTRSTTRCVAPRPIQAHLPILVGGSGPRKTLRTVALRADGWNTAGTVEEVRGEARDPGRALLATSAATSPRSRRPSASRSSLRDDRAAAETAYGALLAANGIEAMGGGAALLGSPAEVADALRPYVELGFATVIVRMPAPYDRETIDRMAQVAELLA